MIVERCYGQGLASLERAEARDSEAMPEIVVRSSVPLELRVSLGSAFFFLARYLSGCRTRKASNEGALSLLGALVDPSCELAQTRDVGVVSRAPMDQADPPVAQDRLD